MSHWKIGFHTGPGGNRDGIGSHWKALDEAGIPASHIAVDDYGPCYDLDNLARDSGVPHVNVYRISVKIPGFNADVPEYELDPDAAAEIWWETVRDNLPSELAMTDARERVWLIVGNEVDKNRSSWLGYWALSVAQRANVEGYKIAAFGWSTGEPEYEDWLTPGMQAYLSYCDMFPEEAGVAVHEYSLTQNLQDGWGYLVGRFEFLADACAELAISMPKVFITEFGWEYQNNPSPVDAVNQMDLAAKLYASYPQIQGAMTWYLGGGFGDIHNQTQRMIQPVTEASLAFGYVPPVEPPLPPPPPPSGETIDLAEYFCPDGTLQHGPIYMVYNNWGQGPERVHLSRSPKGSANHFYVTKNDRWERRYVSDHWIWLQADTSRADNEFYTVHGSPWLPRFMAPGQVYQRSESVDVYSLDSCEHKVSSGITSDIKMVGFHAGLSHELSMPVVELIWLVNNVVEEHYYYAQYVGLVAWKNRWGKESKIREFVPAHEQPNKIEWRCSVLDEWIPSDAPPPPPVDPPPDDLDHQVAWDTTVEMQASGNNGIRLNQAAGIQQQIIKDNQATGFGFQIVTSEVYINGVAYQAAESLNGLSPRRVYKWSSGNPVTWFEDPKSPF